MKFDVLDAKMRLFETVHDVVVLPGINIVARLDGRSFTRLTREVHKFEAPFDPSFRDLMVETTKHLMSCGFDAIYGYTESDEISLLFHPRTSVFNRKHRKYNSVLAAEASAKFSMLLGAPGCFDCRVSELPTVGDVCDYFRWRNEDAHRNALNAHCYWALRKSGVAPGAAAKKLEHLTTAEKNEVLFELGINFNDQPNWQKRGIGLYWEAVERPGVDPHSGVEVTASRKQIKIDYDLPMREAYSEFIRSLLDKVGVVESGAI